MSMIDFVLSGLRRLPRGFSADGHQLGIGLSAALDAQRAGGAEPLDRKMGGPGGAGGAGRPADLPGDRAAGAAR